MLTSHLIFNFPQANWRWLCAKEHNILKKHRQALLGLFRKVMYAETETDFKKCQTDLEEDEVSKLYPQFLAHIQKRYAHRFETWALFVRKAKNLPTRGSNTNNYCEASMKTTKERQFGRVRTFNLPEMLEVICDDSKIFQQKLIDIGHNRDTVQKQSKSKYIGKKSTITRDQVVDIGGDRFLVESETVKDNWYVLDMKSGYCQCPVGSTCAPCKHKAAVSTHLGRASFSVTPTADPCQRALYHYIALGRTMPAHCYRNNGDPNSEPGVEAFIEAQISVEPEKLVARCDANESTMDVEGSDDDRAEFDAELIAKNFSDAMNSYRDMILIHQSKNKQDPATNKSMMAMTKSLKKSMKCTPLTHQHQMHTFGKGTTSGNRTKKGAVIKVNPPAAASRKFKVPGRGPAPLGRPPKDQSGRVQVIVTEDEDTLTKSDRAINEKPKKTHNLAKNVANNETLPDRHTKQ